MLDSRHVILTEPSTLATSTLVPSAHNQLVADQTLFQTTHMLVNHQEVSAVATGSVSSRITMLHTHPILELRIGTLSPTFLHQPKKKENHPNHMDENGETMLTRTPSTSTTKRSPSNPNTKTSTIRCQRNNWVDGTIISHRTMSVWPNVTTELPCLDRTWPSAVSRPRVGLSHQQPGATSKCHLPSTAQHHISITDTTYAKTPEAKQRKLRPVMDMATVMDTDMDTDIVTVPNMAMDTDTDENDEILELTEDKDTSISIKEINMDMVMGMDMVINTVMDTHMLFITVFSSAVSDVTQDSAQLMVDGLHVVIAITVSGRFPILTVSKKLPPVWMYQMSTTVS
jgi:hypothetical protein